MPQSQPGRSLRDRSVLRQLLVTMLAFGALVGLLSPPFAGATLGSSDALSAHFFAMCVAAGLVVGAANFLIFRVVVSRELWKVVAGMRHVNEAVANARDTGAGCGGDCAIEVTSRDVIGEVALSFNSMTEAVGRRITVEATTRSLLAELSGIVQVDKVASRILESLSGVCHARAGVLYADTGTRFELITCFGVDKTDDVLPSLDASQGLAERALSTGNVIHVSPLRDGFEWVHMSTPLGSFRPESLALVPLMAEHKAAGLAVVACPDAELPEEGRFLLDAMRFQAAPYLSNAMLHSKLEVLAAIDELTHLLNRRFGMRRLSEEFSRATRHGVPVSIIMMDIDHFKVFNDTFGHDAGDAVLVSVASVLEQNVRAGDIVCRYGGEELVIVAPGMGLSDAATSAERLRRIIQTTPTLWREQSLHVTVSIGAASWPVAKVSTPEELVTCADEALYHAKKSGRDRVSVHQGDRVIPLSMLTLDTASTRPDARKESGEPRA